MYILYKALSDSKSYKGSLQKKIARSEESFEKKKKPHAESDFFFFFHVM